MDFRVTKGMLGDDGKEPGTGHKEGSPMGNGFYSGIRQTWTIQEKPDGLVVDHLLINFSVLYLPDSIRALTTALLTSKGLDAEDQIG